MASFNNPEEFDQAMEEFLAEHPSFHGVVLMKPDGQAAVGGRASKTDLIRHLRNLADRMERGLIAGDW